MGNEYMSTLWKPHVVVAAIVEQDGRFLMVEEETEDGIRFNQPAGHLEANESLIDAVVREALEETAHHFVPEALIGIYRWRVPHRDRVYLRFAFTGRITAFDPSRALDDGILRATWMTPEEIEAIKTQHRSPLISRCIADYRSGRRYSLDLLTHYVD
jgi:8-oxo-dGTP pyrophosphatase MutT (NUDIX family)